MSSAGARTFFARWENVLTAVVIAAATLALLLATINDYGMAWDEGFTVEREERLREWFARAAGNPSPSRAWSPSLSKLERRSDYLKRAGADAESPWSRGSLRFYWQFAREEPNGHPPFYALLGLAGWAGSHRFLPPPGSYRFGPATLFALTIGAVYAVMARSYGRTAGWMAALGLLTMPRVFAHAHLASYDAPTLCLWFLAVAAFLKAVEPTADGTGRPLAWTLAFGMLWGCAAATKLTGWFVPFPLTAWVMLYRDRRAAKVLIAGGLLAAVVICALNPTWWAEPIRGVQVFLKSNLTREELKPIPTMFFGRLYRFSLPWYNTLAITAIVVPPAALVLALAGIARIVAGRLRDRVGTMMLGCWAFFMALRALPNAPGHDVERQFLGAFVFLACLTGIGLVAIGSWLGRITGPRAARIVTVAILASAVGAGGWSTWRYHPLQLSYYNEIIGGLSGAYRAGMEPTYYWDALTPDVRVWLNSHTEEGRSITFAFPTVSFEYLYHWGLLRHPPIARFGHPPHWFVVMNRRSHLQYFPKSIGQFLLDYSKPAYVKTLDAAPDVPLILVYSGEEAFAAGLILKRGEKSQAEGRKLTHEETLQWIAAHQAWKRARKTRPIWARPVEPAEIGKEFQTADQTKEVARAGYWLCAGIIGEPWFQSPEKIEAKYDRAGEEIKKFAFDTGPRRYRRFKPKGNVRNWVAQVSGPGIEGFFVRPGYDPGRPLYSPAGGYVVKEDVNDPYQDNPKDVWLVQQSLFESTYEVLPKDTAKPKRTP
jgi:multisubunit Na+/H+ antiporter MnhC subunit